MTIHYQILLWTAIVRAIYHLVRRLVVGDGALLTTTRRSIDRVI